MVTWPTHLLRGFARAGPQSAVARKVVSTAGAATAAPDGAGGWRSRWIDSGLIDLASRVISASTLSAQVEVTLAGMTSGAIAGASCGSVAFILEKSIGTPCTVPFRQKGGRRIPILSRMQVSNRV